MTTAAARERDELARRARFGLKEEVRSSEGIAITSHPLATRAAVDVLREGGNACDAALAASVTQTVVEPHQTTVTGILSMLYYDAATSEYTYCNGSMDVPLAGLPGFGPADVAGGRGVAVPGFWPAFEATLARHGSKPRETLLRDAITYARDGFPVHSFLYGDAFMNVSHIGRTAAGREIFFRDGRLIEPGATLVQSRAADTLSRLADEGMSYYLGDFADEVCAVVQAAGGVLAREDFEHYEVRWMDPARGSYRGFGLVGSPPPDTGGTHVIEALHMAEYLDLEKLGRPQESPETLWHLLAIHQEVVGAGARMNDPASHPLPLDVILSKEYAEQRLALLRMQVPNQPLVRTAPGSNHVSVVDAAGNAATVLHSCMSTPWSNGLFAAGVSVCAGGTHFFRTMPKPGHRGTCIIVPTMVLKDDRPMLVAGSPSMALIANVIQNTVNQLDFGDTIAESVARPRFGHPTDTGAQLVEADFPAEVLQGVRDRGMRVDTVSPWYWLNGAYEGIRIDPVTGMRTACGDPRRTSAAEATTTVL